MTSPLVIDYYTDILCVWAWIAERRVEELTSKWDDQIEIRHKCVSVFGDTVGKMDKQWSDRKGFAGFGQHVVESAAPYDNAPVNSKIWAEVRPTTSANAHLVIKAAEVALSPEISSRVAHEIRRAFFVDASDISDLEVLISIAVKEGVERHVLETPLGDGTAAAALMRDYQAAQAQQIAGSPSWVMNNGRQKLYGNVGFHVLDANVEGLLINYGDDASWC